MKNVLYILLMPIVLTSVGIAQTGWSNQSTASSDLYAIFFSDLNNGHSIGKNNLITRTTNGGSTWLGDGGTAHINRWYDINFIDNSTGMIFGSKGTQGLINKTTDGGINWTRVHTAGVDEQISCGTLLDANLAIGLLFNQADGQTYQKKTTNGGTTWTTSLVGDYKINDVSFTNTGKRIGIAVGDNGDIIRTITQGANWQQISNPDKGSNDLLACYMVDRFTGFICGENATVLKTTDAGASWSQLNPGSTSEHFWGIFFTNATTGYLVGSGGEIRKTFNGGADWGTQNSGTNEVLYDVFFINENTGWIVGFTGIRLKTNDGGGTVDFD